MLRLSSIISLTRLLFVLLAGSLSFISYAEDQAIETVLDDTDSAELSVEYTDLEYQIVSASGFLSLAQQVKYTAQHLIALATEKPIEQTAETEQPPLVAKQVMINHAQHFAIAKELAKSWTDEIFQQRLLALVHTLPVETQLRIKQLQAQPMLRVAQEKEQQAISVQHKPEYLLYMNKLRQRPPAASRWQLIENLDKQSGFSSMIIQARAVAIQAISQQVEGWKAAEFWQNKARQEVLEFLFYAYRKTPNAELKHIADSFNQQELNILFTTITDGLTQ